MLCVAHEDVWIPRNRRQGRSRVDARIVHINGQRGRSARDNTRLRVARVGVEETGHRRQRAVCQDEDLEIGVVCKPGVALAHDVAAAIADRQHRQATPGEGHLWKKRS